MKKLELRSEKPEVLIPILHSQFSILNSHGFYEFER